MILTCKFLTIVRYVIYEMFKLPAATQSFVAEPLQAKAVLGERTRLFLVRDCSCLLILVLYSVTCNIL